MKRGKSAGKGAGPATMTSRAKGEEVSRIDRCDRYGYSVDGRKVVKRGRRSGGTCHNDKPGQNGGDGDGKCLCRKWDSSRRVGECKESGGEGGEGGRYPGGTCHNDKPGLDSERVWRWETG